MNSYNLYKHKQIEERAVEIANYIIENNATVRETAKKFGISKSTVHKDVTERLSRIDPLLAGQARKILEVNKAERHIRGRHGNPVKNTCICPMPSIGTTFSESKAYRVHYDTPCLCLKPKTGCYKALRRNRPVLADLCGHPAR